MARRVGRFWEREKGEGKMVKWREDGVNLGVRMVGEDDLILRVIGPRFAPA